MITWVWLSPCLSQIRRGAGVSCGLISARQDSKAEFMPEARGLNTNRVNRPSPKAAPAAGRMKRQAETPAARMATSSLRRLRVTKAASTPNRNTNGRSCRITAGDFKRVRPSWLRKLISLLAARLRDRSTKLIRITTEASRAAAAPMPMTLWAST